MTSTVQTEMFTIKVTKHTKPNAIFISLHICAIIPQSVILIDKSAVKKEEVDRRCNNQYSRASS